MVKALGLLIGMLLAVVTGSRASAGSQAEIPFPDLFTVPLCNIHHIRFLLYGFEREERAGVSTEEILRRMLKRAHIPLVEENNDDLVPTLAVGAFAHVADGRCYWIIDSSLNEPVTLLGGPHDDRIKYARIWEGNASLGVSSASGCRETAARHTSDLVWFFITAYRNAKAKCDRTESTPGAAAAGIGEPQLPQRQELIPQDDCRLSRTTSFKLYGAGDARDERSQSDEVLRRLLRDAGIPLTQGYDGKAGAQFYVSVRASALEGVCLYDIKSGVQEAVKLMRPTGPQQVARASTWEGQSQWGVASREKVGVGGSCWGYASKLGSEAVRHFIESYKAAEGTCGKDGSAAGRESTDVPN